MRGVFWLVPLAALLSLVLIGLGFLPWEKPGPPLRPGYAAAEAVALTHWDQPTIDKGRRFWSEGYARFFWRKGTVGLILAGILFLGIHRKLRALPGGGIWTALVALLLITLLLEVVNLPFGLAGLKAARAVGISKQSVGFWLTDYVKGSGISLVTTAVAGLVALFLLHAMPRWWPLPATILAGLGGIVVAVILPLAVDPLFNHFTPLDRPALRARFLEIAGQAGLPAREVLVCDASRRTTALNAYFTGFGPTRRIVVYDTLIDSMRPDEAALVLAHEAGHWRLGHIQRGILWGTLGAGLGLLLAGFLLRAAFAGGGLGLRGPFDPAAAPFLYLLLWYGTLLSLPVENAVSRRFESQADQFALDLTGDGAAAIRTEESLARRNLSDVAPPPFMEALLYTHPATLDRIAQAGRFMGRPKGPAAVRDGGAAPGADSGAAGADSGADVPSRRSP